MNHSAVLGNKSPGISQIGGKFITWMGPDIADMSIIMKTGEDYLGHETIRVGYSLDQNGDKKKTVYFVREIRRETIVEHNFQNQLLNEKQVWKFVNEFEDPKFMQDKNQNVGDLFIGKLLSCQSSNKACYFIYEYIPGLFLNRLLSKISRLSIKEVKFFSAGILSILEHL